MNKNEIEEDSKKIANIIVSIYEMETKYYMLCVYSIVVTVVAIFLAIKTFA